MDLLLQAIQARLPKELQTAVEQHLQWLQGGDFEAVLSSPEAKQLLGHETVSNNESRFDGRTSWQDWLFNRSCTLLSDRTSADLAALYLCVGYAALLSFVQASITGPPLPFDCARTVLPSDIAQERERQGQVRHELLAGLSRDGVAAYKLTSNIELLCLADTIFTNPAILKNLPFARWVRLRILFIHQRLMSEVSASLQKLIYEELEHVAEELASYPASQDLKCSFLLERATIHLHHGLEKLAREDIESARIARHFEYRLTGRLGKRTKFQQQDISQLVVLAKSKDGVAEFKKADAQNKAPAVAAQPESIDLNDDTLLERIAFSQTARMGPSDNEGLPTALAELDPADQPQLQPLDSTILLSFASSITNTSPEHGLTREELLPYANRVLDGGSSNWQVYTQALLVRSRVEGYKSRTVERGLLQLQALVDQVIAETTDKIGKNSSTDAAASSSTFLPRAKPSESAPVAERLQCVFQLASPMRWGLEAELAARWASLGGLRSALEIYERLEMWAEAALCYAATENEGKARQMVRRQLYHRKDESTANTEDDDNEQKWDGKARDPPPLDAPRLYCILGDLDQSPELYEAAWTVSKGRYARAQRSLGRHHFSQRKYEQAVEAYTKSLKANQINHQTWFALGCAHLELEQYSQAVEAFSRCVQLDDTDAEAWSNLAAALLKMKPEEHPVATHTLAALDEDDGTNGLDVKVTSIQRNRLNALRAFQRAASLKHSSYQIWQNVLITAASLSPPDWSSVLSAQRSLIDLRGATVGEACIDTEILEHLVQHVVTSADQYDPSKPGLSRMTVKLIDESVVPHITGSAVLWQVVAKLALWRKRPATALDAEEKAWRAVTTQPGWETQNESRWNDVVEATIRLCDSYESLGPMEKTEGLAAGAGTLVASDWKFKARSAIRTILSRGRNSWEGTAGWERLLEAQQSLKG